MLAARNQCAQFTPCGHEPALDAKKEQRQSDKGVHKPHDQAHQLMRRHAHQRDLKYGEKQEQRAESDKHFMQHFRHKPEKDCRD